MTPALLARLRLLLDHLAELDQTDRECPLIPAPCRVALYPGGEAPWDTCESLPCDTGRAGQLWVAAQPATVQEQGGGCRRIIWTAQVGIVRCVAGPRNDGSPPSVMDVESDALQQAADSAAIKAAVTDQELTESWGLPAVELVSWSPLGPTGGCAGGAWTIRGVLDECC